MPIELACPGCRKVLRLAEPPAGKKVRCPDCGQAVPVPIPGAVTSPDLLASRANVPHGATLAGPAHIPTAHVPRQKTEAVPRLLGNYEVIEELGRGGMGTVYLARQTSLDRLVALKVMDARKAAHPSFLARFTREAFASAQLVHHNIVQIYDIHVDGNLHFYSMEYVKGESLFHVVNREGRLDPEVAVGYVLQAARGLKFGHDMGMVHRDVKPENLLLNEHGIIKVADLGLVKVPYAEEIESAPQESSAPKTGLAQGLSQVTRIGSAVGTPTYMAPEQARDASKVDARADVYSLGCTLYVLLTGKPPFEGKTVFELISKHQSEAVVLPDALIKRVPRSLSAILSKMLAKSPEDRHQDMAAVIADFEKFLGVQQTGPFTPREEHATALEKSVRAFNELPVLQLRRHAVAVFALCCGLGFLTCVLFGWLRGAGAIIGLALLTPLIYALIRGWRERSYLFTRVRAFVLDSSWTEWAYATLGTILFLLILYLLGLLWLWLLMAVAGVGLAVACYFRVDAPAALARRTPLRQAEKLLRSMRLQGLDEASLRVFVCKYAGDDWEEFYEALFGYEAKRRARNWLRGETARRRRRFAAWREPILAWIDAQQEARKEARERKLLQAVEAKALEAAGATAAEAQEKAGQMADALIQQASQVKKGESAAPEAAPAPKPAMRQLIETAQKPATTATTEPERKFSLGPLAGLLNAFFGPPVRFLVGAFLLVLWLMWLDQNQAAGGSVVTKITTAIERGNWQDLDPVGEALDVPLPELLRELFHGFRPAIAGLILVLSVLTSRWQMTAAAWLSGFIVLFGPGMGVPTFGSFPPGVTSAAAGLGVFLVGMILCATQPPHSEIEKPEFEEDPNGIILRR